MLYSASQADKQKKKKSVVSPFYAPSGFHRLNNTANTGKIKFSQRLIPDPLNHYLALRGVQVGGESMESSSGKGLR